MLLTKEDDYAIRIMRAIKDGNKHRMKDICQEEEIPEAFAYKILKKLKNASILEVERGAAGGCRLGKSLCDITLYDIVTAVDDEPLVMPCMHQRCNRNKANSPCTVHIELSKIQNVLMEELKGRTLDNLF